MQPHLPILNDVRTARAAISSSISPSPLSPSPQLGARWGFPVCFKFESFHTTGSFKERGALNKLLSLTAAERSCGIIAASAGNHAQAVAYHAQRLGIPATIVMPVNAPLVKVQNTESYGATVILEGASYDEALNYSRVVQAERRLTFIHGFDDSWIIAGQGTIGLELLEQDPDLDCVIVPVGGGGLIAGIALAVKELKPSVRVIGVQFEGIPSMKAALEAGHVVQLPAKPTMADGIAVCHAGDLCLELVRRYVDEVVTVSEEEIAGAVLLLLEREKVVAEGAAAVGVAAISAGRIGGLESKRVALILSGGNIDVTRLSRVIAHGLARDGRLARIQVVVPDLPGQLARILALIAAARGNVLEIEHERAFAHGHVGETAIMLTVETRGPEHIVQIRDELARAGINVAS